MRTRIPTGHPQVTYHKSMCHWAFWLCYINLIALVEVGDALSSLQFPHIYPDPESRALRKMLVCAVLYLSIFPAHRFQRQMIVECQWITYW